MYPEDRRYTKEHEWIRLEGDRGTVGITDYAQEQLGDVVFLELPEVGRRLAPGEVFGTVESVKAVSELYAPVAGEVVGTSVLNGPAVGRGPGELGDTFPRRHIGPSEEDVREMLAFLGRDSLDALVEETIPAGIRLRRPLDLPAPLGESAALAELRKRAEKNRVFRSFLGMGYHGCLTPGVIQRNVLENPGWYTQYTPYQAEIAQGRLEALLNFQTMVADLTGLPLANASLLDEATAAAEAMHMCRAIAGDGRPAFFAAEECHPQTLAVVKTRARSLGIEVRVGPAAEVDLSRSDVFGVLLQYPTTDG